MKILMIGGTGTISSAVTRRLAALNEDLTLINRGNRNENLPKNVKTISCDANNEEELKKALEGMKFDCVANFIAFTPDQVEKDYRVFKDITKQYIFISSATVYQKPVPDFPITEGASMNNPFSNYATNKILCENALMKHYREDQFPVTIVRPSHTYDEKAVPLGAHGMKGSYTILKRMLEGKPILIHGDGTTLWTMTHNSDFAIGFTGLMGNPHAIGEAVQITSDEILTWNKIYEIVADALGVKLNAVHITSDFLSETIDMDFKGSLIGDKANCVWMDNSKIKRLVPEYKATIRFDQGVRKTIEYVMSHPECQVEDPEFDAYIDKVVEVREEAIRKILGK